MNKSVCERDNAVWEAKKMERDLKFTEEENRSLKQDLDAAKSWMRQAQSQIDELQVKIRSSNTESKEVKGEILNCCLI